MTEPATSSTLAREDIILAIAAGADGPFELDPIRVMKGCFLVAQRGRPGWRAAFDFQPYEYGPFDRGVYDARDRLVRQRLLGVARAGRYPAYSLTEAGRAWVAELQADLGEDDLRWFARIGHYVTSKSFSQLLEDVYAAYPEYAVRSVVR